MKDYFKQLVDKQRKLLPSIKHEWLNYKLSSNNDFINYTHEKILELEFILNPKRQEPNSGFEFEDEYLRYMRKYSLIIYDRANEIISQLKEFHFLDKVDLDFILEVERGGHKIRYFIEYMGKLSDSDYWKKLSYAHQKADYSDFSNEILKTLFSSNRQEKEKLMNPRELELLNSLPEMFTIYRGMSKKEYDSGNFNISWTLKKDKADFFAKRNNMFGKNEQVIHEIEVYKKDITAYLIERGEEEIIYF